MLVSSQDQSRPSDHAKAEESADKVQPAASIAPLERSRVDIVDRIQCSHRQPAGREQSRPELLTRLLLCQQASEYTSHEQGHVLERIAVAGLGALVRGEILSAQPLLRLFDEGRGFGVAVVMLRHVSFGGNVDCCAVWEDGEHVVEWNGEEGKVDRHGALWLLSSLPELVCLSQMVRLELCRKSKVGK